ncbi:bifunctional folylpolyglutamate synthase/dihydrofolate synthase [Amphiplicatus metriothermophilus]|uniref:Dihydrofolate synthase/folylpolyglutamate synthase n=1 Tax=Amphiplicatus metriothermophilus TaxID=1519374 RepID=A0A239PK45_9PROT|nr:folylpolyglutamate synthase/dihydrofolate synthase family protein [Amphiplicatus metriothermophilus]MBB5517499.1 dihydrofolate synthase/folylpolyglutamate synthase [Amphiplicatus metriothermophilus]SNT68166.1 dihydrofolate synthase / folylpolyglutamate synthase [Amphiplicatus metriothermophilus]
MKDPAAVLARLAERRPALIDLGLDRMKDALARLGDPHRRLPPVIHVAGTNGKGSTVAYIRAILEAAGNSVHVYTSPHLVRFNERIVLAGREIDDAHLCDALERCDRDVGPKALTFFEATTCAAFLAFAETPADYLVLEVGLGGRLDATNVIDAPLATAVAPVALDHQQFLGDTLAAIAGEKAGIFRAGAPAVVGPQTPEAMQVFEARANAVGAPFFAYGLGWNAFLEHGRLVYQDDDGLSDLDPPRLPGVHQIANAGLAVATVKAAGLGFDDNILSAGVVSARWPARLQRLRRGPIVDFARARFGDEAEIWLDGGHNPHAARAVAAAMADMEEKAPRPLVLIAGMQANKDQEGFFAAFAGVASAVFTVRADHDGAAPPEDVAAAAERAGLPARPCASIEEALRLAVGESRAPARLLICGSLYLAGEVLRENG